MILDLLQDSFNKDRFIEFIRLITENFKPLDEHLEGIESENYTVFPVSSFKDNNDLNFQIILVETNKPSKIEKARIEQREIIRKYINQNLYSMPSGILAVFYSPDYPLWRLSFVEIDWERRGKLKTPPKRFSYLVGQGEPIHTPAKQLSKLLENLPFTIEEIKEAFSIEPLREEFFDEYLLIFNKLWKSILEQLKTKEKDYLLKSKETAHQILNRLIFVYFIQRKKEWFPDILGEKLLIDYLWKEYKTYIEKNPSEKNTFFTKWLKTLFLFGFNKKYPEITGRPELRTLPENIKQLFANLPYLNGGLFAENEFRQTEF